MATSKCYKPNTVGCYWIWLWSRQFLMDYMLLTLNPITKIWPLVERKLSLQLDSFQQQQLTSWESRRGNQNAVQKWQTGSLSKLGYIHMCQTSCRHFCNCPIQLNVWLRYMKWIIQLINRQSNGQMWRLEVRSGNKLVWKQNRRHDQIAERSETLGML